MSFNNFLMQLLSTYFTNTLLLLLDKPSTYNMFRKEYVCQLVGRREGLFVFSFTTGQLKTQMTNKQNVLIAL